MQSAFDILFRTDASSTLGGGHLSRCLALAGELRAQGARCAFLIREACPTRLTNAIVAQGHTLLSLPGPVPDARHQEQDAQLCQIALAGLGRARWLVVDHYGLDAHWEKAMRCAASRVLAIDDLADRAHDCELLLDQNPIKPDPTRYAGKVSAACHCLLGSRYALLRPEFRQVSTSYPDPAAPRPLRLLLMFGAADPTGLSLRVLRMLQHAQYGLAIDALAGSLFSRLAELQSLAAGMQHVRILVDPPEIASLMQQADLAMGSPGVSAWERCSLGLPTLAISQTANQEESGQALAEAGAHLYLGRAQALRDEDIDNALQLLLRNRHLRSAMRQAGLRLCDGRGAARVARLMWPRPIALRAVGLEDAPLLFSWRNDERVRRHSRDPGMLHYPAHLAWLEQTLSRSNECLLLALSSQQAVACLRFTLQGQQARMSIYTDPTLQGQGWGSATLAAAMQWLRRERPSINCIEAEVLPHNSSSHAMFLAAGYTPRWTGYQFHMDESTMDKTFNEDAHV